MHVGVVGSYHIKNVEVSQKIIGNISTILLEYSCLCYTHCYRWLESQASAKALLNPQCTFSMHQHVESSIINCVEPVPPSLDGIVSLPLSCGVRFLLDFREA